MRGPNKFRSYAIDWSGKIHASVLILRYRSICERTLLLCLWEARFQYGRSSYDGLFDRDLALAATTAFFLFIARIFISPIELPPISK